MAGLSQLRRVHGALERSSPAERRVADVVQESPQDVVVLSIMSLARRARVSAPHRASVVRAAGVALRGGEPTAVRLHTMNPVLLDRRLPFERAEEPVITGGEEGRTVA